MAVRVAQVSGARLAEFLGRLRGVDRVDVTSMPREWAPLKPALLEFVRGYRSAGEKAPRFSGVPLCLFGSEWSGFPSIVRKSAARGRCRDCLARDACGFEPEVPPELFPISRAPLLQRWRDYGNAFEKATGNDAVGSSASVLEKIVAAYPGPVSLEPSVLVSEGIDAALRFVVFPHRSGVGDEARAQYETALGCAESVLANLGLERCPELFAAVAGLDPVPVPLGLDGRDDSWSVKMYLRLEDADLAQKQRLNETLSRFAAGLSPVSLGPLQMVGLVFDRSGLQTVKAYLVARPTRRGGEDFPPPLGADHPLVALAGDRALATLDIWRRGARRPNKWDFNVRHHYLAGAAAEDLVARSGSPTGAAELRPLLVGPTYRADVVAVGVRERTLALYMELN
jgi:hypothetical protein